MRLLIGSLVAGAGGLILTDSLLFGWCVAGAIMVTAGAFDLWRSAR